MVWWWPPARVGLDPPIRVEEELLEKDSPARIGSNRGTLTLLLPHRRSPPSEACRPAALALLPMALKTWVGLNGSSAHSLVVIPAAASERCEQLEARSGLQVGALVEIGDCLSPIGWFVYEQEDGRRCGAVRWPLH